MVDLISRNMVDNGAVTEVFHTKGERMWAIDGIWRGAGVDFTRYNDLKIREIINSFFVTGELMRTMMLLHESYQYFIHLIVFLNMRR
jgi:hypothetical protein